MVQYSPVVHDQARSLYFQGLKAPDIAKTLRIQEASVKQWIATGDWVEQLRTRNQSAAAQRSDVIIEQEKPALIERHSRIIQKFDRHVETALDKKTIKPRDLLNLAKTAGAVSTMADNTMGLKKPASLQLFVQFNLRPASVEDVRAQGAEKIFDVPSTCVAMPDESPSAPRALPAAAAADQASLPEPHALPA